MKKKYEHLYAVEYSKPDLMDEYGYKYVIPGLSYAFRTEKGFEHFKEVYNLKVRNIQEKKYMNTNDSIKLIYFEPIIIDEPSTFWKKEDIKKGMKHFIGLSNGSYVDCYYKHYKNYTLVIRPNPNSMEVYKPYDKFSMSKEWG